MATSKKHPGGSPNWGGARPRKKDEGAVDSGALQQNRGSRAKTQQAADAPGRPSNASNPSSDAPKRDIDATNGAGDAPKPPAKRSMLMDGPTALALMEQVKDMMQGQRKPEQNPFRLPEFPPNARPKKKSQLMAMDSATSWASSQWESGAWAQGVFSSLGAEGLLFLGYPYLSELAQRPEYRVISETIADDATRKWIDFEVTGKENAESGADAEKKRDAERQQAIDESRPTFKDPDPDKRKDKIGKAGKTEKVKQLKDELDRLEVRDRFYAIIRDDGFFGRSHLHLNFGEDSDDPKGAQELKTPIGNGRDKLSRRKVSKERPLKKIRVIEPVWVYPIAYNATNPLADDWYNPQTWYVMGREIHTSRLLPFITRPVPDLLKPAYSFGGLSLSQMAKPYVDIWLTTRQAVADLIRAFSIMCLSTDMQTNSAPGGTAGLGNVAARAALFNMYRDNMGLFLLNKDTEEFSNVSAPLGSLDHLQAQAQEHMCVQEGTLIETARGAVPIEEMITDDRVLTRAGFAPIKWIGVTKLVDTFIEIEAGDSILRVTEEHPIWSESTNEFVSARAVSLSHRLLALETASQESTANPSRGAAAGGGQPSAAITATRRLAAFCTTLCGKLTEVLSRTVTRSITRTTTALTTIGETWSWSLAPSTWSGTAASVALSNASTQSNASAVNTSRLHGSERDTAQSLARAAHTSFAFARRSTPGHASVAETTSRPSESARPDSVQVRAYSVPVSRVSAIKVSRQPVYDIEVDGSPEFFANGILVHNSSVSRIPLVKLTGISPSGLNASSDGEVRVYYDTISAFQNRALRKHLTQIIDFVQLSLWGEIDQEITFEFEPLWDMTAQELADLQKAEVERDEKLVDMGAFAPAEIRKIKINDPKLPFTGLDPDDLPELKEEEEEGLVPEGAGKGLEAVLGEPDGEGGKQPAGKPGDKDTAPSGKAKGGDDKQNGKADKSKPNGKGGGKVTVTIAHDQAADGQTSKDLVAYVDHWADTNTQCRACAMFARTNDSLDGNACELVAGEISGLAHCREFQSKEPGAKDEAVPPSDEPPPLEWNKYAPFMRAHDLDRRGYLEGLTNIKLSPNVDDWNAHYDADKDEIGVQQKLTEKPGDEQVRTLLHEAGHRGHYKADPDLYERFKKAGLVNIDAFLDMANQAHLDDYAATGKVEGLGYEIFAESYARAMLGLDMPEPLRAFWDEENKSLAHDAEWNEGKHKRDEAGRFSGSGSLFHGSNEEFSEFDPKQIGSRDPGYLGRGFYFSTDPEIARTNNYRMKADVNLDRPLHLQMPDLKTDKRTIIRSALRLPKNASTENVDRALEEAGHDGVILDYTPAGYPHQEVMVRSNDRIKNVTSEPGGAAPASKKAIAKQLLEKGVTNAEMLKALAWPTISMPAMAKALNMNLEKTKKDGATVYRGTPFTDEQMAEVERQKAERKAQRGPGGPRSQPEETWSLLQFLAGRGGIRADDALISDLKQSFGGKNKFVPGFGQLVRPDKQVSEAGNRGGAKRPMSLDQALRAAVEAGYLTEHGNVTGGAESTYIAELLEAVDTEARGQRVYRQGYQPDNVPTDPAELEHAEYQYIQSINDALAAGGGTLSDTEWNRALEMWSREGLTDPDTILERLFLESRDKDIEGGGTNGEEPRIEDWDSPPDDDA
jgi:hypothetical protein